MHTHGFHGLQTVLILYITQRVVTFGDLVHTKICLVVRIRRSNKSLSFNIHPDCLLDSQEFAPLVFIGLDYHWIETHRRIMD